MPLLFYFISLLNIFGCSFGKSLPSATMLSATEPIYNNLQFWAAHPGKTDPSDRVPQDLKNEIRDTLADVFFIHPTTYTEGARSMGWNANINDQKLNDKTDNTSILYQASVFNEYSRVFAPRYRQANLKAFFANGEDSAKIALEIAYSDVKKAFQYYLDHFNNGRPIIIASHSQGTLHAARLLKDLFENKPLYKQLVCAYIIGLPVFENYFSGLKPCITASQTGCIVSWRTFLEGYQPAYIDKEKGKAIVINPLTWTTDTLQVEASLNEGGILRNFDKVIPEMVSTQIHGNILWSSKPRFFGSIFLKTKNYHIADYNLFYKNIRENTGVRIKAFLAK
ncbi:MAG: DUF3089 domain-containing protein [Ginsengibacter sp.]